MPTTSGLSFYQTDATTSQAITYGFDVLSAGDITVISVASNGAQVVLTLNTDYTLDIDTKTVTCTAASWTSLPNHPDIYPTSDIRIYRTTSILPSIDFKSGAVLSENDLDNAYKQGLFAAQEMTEDAALTGAGVQAVTTGSIEAGAVTGDKIAAGAVDTLQLANASVDNTKLQPGAVNQLNLQASSINTASLALGAVTHDRLAAVAVETDNIKDANVTQAKVDKASVADMEGQSATDGVVTPDVLKHSPFAPKCYGSVSLATTTDTTFSNSYNVASVSANNVERTITFSDDLSSPADYVVLATITGAGADFDAPSIVSKSTTGFTVDFNNGANSGRGIDFVVFGSTFA